jgi:phytoene dehydrogenase-like protein
MGLFAVFAFALCTEGELCPYVLPSQPCFLSIIHIVDKKRAPEGWSAVVGDLPGVHKALGFIFGVSSLPYGNPNSPVQI